MSNNHRRGRCGRCRRDGLKIETRFPDGALCVTCYAAAVRARGQCSACHVERLVPGRDMHGQPLCVDCAGIRRSFTCSRCGTEWALRRGICEWCFLADDLDQLLTGPVDLAPLRKRFLQSARPDSITIWLYQEHARQLLVGLATGTVALTHEALDANQPRQCADHLRAILVDVGQLPHRDVFVGRFDRWVVERLHDHAQHPDDERLLRLFASWHLRPKLQTRADNATIRAGSLKNSTQQIKVAGEFLGWLRARDRELRSCRQGDLDEFLTTPPTTHREVATFIAWAHTSQQGPRLKVRARQVHHSPMLDQDRRIELLRNTLSPDSGSLDYRVAAVLVLLFAQRFNSIAALRVEDIVITGGTEAEVGICLGEGITPIPEPFGTMFRDLLANRANLNTATNPASPWLFPGARAGSHRTENTLRSEVTKMGIGLLGARNAALRQLVLDCPPPIVADLLGYSYNTADRHAIQAGSPWTSYAAIRSHRSEPVRKHN